MIYTIEELEFQTTKSGIKKATVDLAYSDKDGNAFTEKAITVWSDFPSFSNLKIGDGVEGDVVVKQNGQYTNRTLYAPRPVSVKTASGGTKQGFGGGSAMMEKKAQGIAKSQERKEIGIELSSTARDATLIVTTFYPELTQAQYKDEDIKKEWLKWRKWLRDNFGEASDPTEALPF